MDIEYINLMIGITALISSFFAHLRHSRCCYGLIDIDMKTSRNNTPPDTPINNNESSALLKERSAKSLRAGLLETSESKTDPIDIPKKPIIKNWL